jgi:Bacterial PH domain
MSNPEFFRPRSSVVIAYIGYALLIGAILQSFWTANLNDIAITFAATAVIGAFIFFIIHRPSLLIGDEGVIIQNPIQRVELGWEDVIEIETQYALTFYTTKGKKFSAWAALAPGRYHQRTVNSTEVKFMIPKDMTIIRPGDSPRSDSGAAAYIARMRWDAFKKRHDA